VCIKYEDTKRNKIENKNETFFDPEELKLQQKELFFEKNMNFRKAKSLQRL
jgi:hypothetical protein